MWISKHHLPSGFIVHNVDKHYMNISMLSQAVHDNSRFVSTVPPTSQGFWLNCSVHQTSHMRYSLSDLTGQSKGKDVPRTFSRGSPDSGVQLTGSNCHIWSLPQPGTYRLGQEGQKGSRCTKHIFSQNKLCLTTYTHILMQKKQICE